MILQLRCTSARSCSCTRVSTSCPRTEEWLTSCGSSESDDSVDLVMMSSC